MSGVLYASMERELAAHASELATVSLGLGALTVMKLALVWEM